MDGRKRELECACRCAYVSVGVRVDSPSTVALNRLCRWTSVPLHTPFGAIFQARTRVAHRIRASRLPRRASRRLARVSVAHSLVLGALPARASARGERGHWGRETESETEKKETGKQKSCTSVTKHTHTKSGKTHTRDEPERSGPVAFIGGHARNAFRDAFVFLEAEILIVLALFASFLLCLR